MAQPTPCQTPGAQFHTWITTDSVGVSVDLPFEFTSMTAEEAQILDTNLHNVLELVLTPYFVNKK